MNCNANSTDDNCNAPNNGSTGKVRTSSMRRSSQLSLRRLSSQVEILFSQVLGIDSFGDLSSSSIQTQDVMNGIKDSMNFVKCQKAADSDGCNDGTRQAEAKEKDNLPHQKTEMTPNTNHTKRNGTRRSAVDSCKGEEREPFNDKWNSLMKFKF